MSLKLDIDHCISGLELGSKNLGLEMELMTTVRLGLYTNGLGLRFFFLNLFIS